VLPDGCSDIILGLGDMRGATAVGTMRTAAVYSLTGPIDYFGVRFRPGRALPFLGVPLSEITDAHVALDDLWGADAHELTEVASEERVMRMERVLSRRLAKWSPARHTDEPLTSRAIALMRQARGGVGIGAVAAALGVGERRLERAFHRSVGLPPKVFARVMRLRRALRQIDAATAGPPAPLGWARLALDAGYADQPHFIREFKALVGETPARYAAERHGVGFVQYDDARDA
jgi:AraC-like DNA-binding protein